MPRSMNLTMPAAIVTGTFDPGKTFGPLTVTESINIPALPSPFGFTYGAAGSGFIDAMTKLYSGTLAVAATVDFDLTTLVDPDNVAVTFARVKAIVVWCFTGDGVASLTIGPSPTNGFVGPFGTGGAIQVGPGYAPAGGTARSVALPFFNGAANGWVVDATHKSIRLTGVGAACQYGFLAAGNLT